MDPFEKLTVPKEADWEPKHLPGAKFKDEDARQLADALSVLDQKLNWVMSHTAVAYNMAADAKSFSDRWKSPLNFALSVILFLASTIGTTLLVIKVSETAHTAPVVEIKAK